MEENNIILLEDERYVKVEGNKKRQREKIKKMFKRCVILFAALVSIIVVIRLFPHIKELWHSFSQTNQGGELSTDTNKDTETTENNGSLNQDANQSQESEKIPDGSYQIKQGTSEYKSINESGCEFDFAEVISPPTLSEIYKKYGNEAPVVLITHSNKRESFSNGKYYSQSDNFYSDSENIGEIGALLTSELNSLGINTIHLDELYASGSIINSREEYESSLKSTLKKYPSISYVFNISRGIYINDDLTMQKGLTSYQDSNYAQLNITSGTSWDETNESQTENVLFAFDFASFANKMVSNLVSQNIISRFELSQNITPFVMNIDIGTYANSFSEASDSCKLFATVFYEYLISKSPT